MMPIREFNIKERLSGIRMTAYDDKVKENQMKKILHENYNFNILHLFLFNFNLINFISLGFRV